MERSTMDDLSNPAAPSAPLPESAAPAVDTSPVEGATTENDAPKTETATPPDKGATTEEGEKPEKPKQKASERIGELYSRAKQAERQRDFLMAELERLKKPLTAPENREELSFSEQQALDVRQAVREERAAEKQSEAERAAETAWTARQAVFDVRVEEARSRMPDFDTVVYSDAVKISPVGAEFIHDSEKGPEVAYWLGKNLSEAARIASLPPHRQGAELARIEARLTAAPTVRKTSQAPAPTPQVGGGSSPAARDPANMSVADMQKLLLKRR
jgi:hypothetical protein